MTTSRKFSSRLIAFPIATIGAVFALAASAHATTYCVDYASCPAGGVAKATLEASIVASDANPDHDTIRLGAGTFAGSVDSADQAVDIIGSGTGTTEIDGSGAGSVVFLANGQSQITDLTVRLTQNNEVGIRLQHGASAHRVEVLGAHALVSDDGIVAEDPGSDMTSVRIDLGDSQVGYGIRDNGGTITGADITAGLGIVPGLAGTIARRVTVRSSTPFYIFGGTLNVADALLMPHPDDPKNPNFEAAEVKNSSDGSSAFRTAADLTVVGQGIGAGIDVYSNPQASTGTASAHISGALITGVLHPLFRQGGSPIKTADISIDHSAFDLSKVTDFPGNGSLTVGPGNITGNVDPKFVNPAAGDYRLSFDSPLLDKGPIGVPLSDDDPDLAGNDRARDSDGNASAIRDIGAYEYQRLAPTAVISTAASTFDAGQSSDPDGDPLTFNWAFGDGASASSVNAAHVFGAPGSYVTQLTTTDPTGLSSSASTTTVVPVGGTAGGAGGSAAAPVLSGLSESARSWLERNKLPNIASKKIGTTFRFKLDQPAKVRFVFSRKSDRARALGFAAHAGANKLHFLGRISKKTKLRPGRYTVTVTATNAAGKKSNPQSLSFRIAR